MTSLSQNQMQKMLQRLSPQQIQMIKLLELPTIQLEQRIKKEIEENPALEEERDDSDETQPKEINIEEYKKNEETPSYKLHVNNHSKDDKIMAIPLSDGHTLTEYLNEQLSYISLSEKEESIARFIIGSLDRSGYLRRSIDSLADDLAFNMGIEASAVEIERALSHVQSLEPRGIAARDLQETLLLQLRSKPRTRTVITAMRVVSDYFDLLAKKHYDKIVQRLGISEKDFRAVVSTIINLSPKPANLYAEQLQSEPTIQVVPDFILENEGGILEITLNNSYGDIKINKSYMDLLANLIKDSKIAAKESSDHIAEETREAAQFIKQKIDSARWFISAVKQRNATLILTMNAILNFQKDYFVDGDETCLKPMILKDIADLTGLDVSTISRVVNSKYIQTDFGVFSLKYFFSEAMKTSDGEEVSSREIKSILSSCVENEDKRFPLTDEALMIILQEKGYQIARRTVAKYREMLEIPVARMRKEF